MGKVGQGGPVASAGSLGGAVGHAGPAWSGWSPEPSANGRLFSLSRKPARLPP